MAGQPARRREPFSFPDVPGPAYLPEMEARRVLNKFIETKNPLGKDFSDPDGQDDDWQRRLGPPGLPAQGPAGGD